MRFLIDECLTVELVAVAADAGYEAYHVARVGRAGWKDPQVMRYAREGDFVLVTNNAADFRRLYTAEPLHAGLVILVPAVSLEIQRLLFKVVLDHLVVSGEPINQVLEIDLDGETACLSIYDLSPED